MYNNAKVNANKLLLNNKAQKARFKLLRPFSKAYNILVYICGFSSYIARFKVLARSIIPINNYIR